MEEYENGSQTIKILNNVSDYQVLYEILNKNDGFYSPTNTQAPSLKNFWLQAFFRHYGASRRLAITIVSVNSTPKLIMPLQVKGNDCLEFLCDETSDYNDFLYHDSDGAILKYAIKFWASWGIRKFQFNGLPSDSKTLDYLCAIAAEDGWRISTTDCDSIPVVITQTDEPIQNWKGVKSQRIIRYQRKEKALIKVSDVSFHLIENKSQLFSEFQNFKKIHIGRWNVIGINSKYSDYRRETFILDVCEEAIKCNSLFLPFMKINGSLASFIIGFRSGDTIFDWNTSFSTEFYKWSPGALLLLNVLSNSRLYGFTKYNLLKGVEEHKFIWTNTLEKNISCSLDVI